MPFTKLSADYIRGFTAGLQAAGSQFVGAVADLADSKKKMTEEQAERVAALIVTHRAEIREGKPGFIRWNTQANCFEWYEGRD